MGKGVHRGKRGSDALGRQWEERESRVDTEMKGMMGHWTFGFWE